jgi:hypothetical protein
LNADGTLDTSFGTTTSDFVFLIRGLAHQADGKVVLVGDFPDVFGTPRQGIARLNEDGSLDTDFGNGLSGAAPLLVRAVLIQPDGKVLVGGHFTSINGVARTGFARLIVGCPTITLSPATLPDGTVGAPFSQLLTASGGTAPYNFSVGAGSLPIGIPLTGGGLFQGTPRVPGTYTFTLVATDTNGCTGSQQYTVTIACPTISVLPANPTLPAATVGANYSGVSFLGSGGTGPYGLTLTGGSLPPGMNFSSGAVVGTPTASGTFNFTVTATETTSSCSGSREYTLTVNPAACPTISVLPTNPTLPTATVGVNYSGVSFLGSGSIGPYGLTLTGGSLPPGMNFSSGAVVGTPTASGTFNFTVTATETLSGCSGSREYSLTVNPATVGTPVLVNDRVNLVITGQSVEAATCPGYAADIVLTGTLTNTGTTTITDPFFEVIELQASSGVPTALPYRLLTATGASCGSGGLVGSVQPVGGAGFVLNPGQSVPVTFRLALPTMGRLRFFVNVRGVVPVISRRTQAVAKRPVRVVSGLEEVAVGEKSLRNR